MILRILIRFFLPKIPLTANILEIGNGKISKAYNKLGYTNHYIIGNREEIRTNIKTSYIYEAHKTFDDETFDIIFDTKYKELPYKYSRILKLNGYFIGKYYKKCQK